MKLIKERPRKHLVPITVRIAAASADRYRRARELAAQHGAVIDLRTVVERAIDGALAEACAFEPATATGGIPSGGKTATEAPSRAGAVPAGRTVTSARTRRDAAGNAASEVRPDAPADARSDR